MAPITHISQLDFNQSYTYAGYLSWKFADAVELIKGQLTRKMSAPAEQH